MPLKDKQARAEYCKRYRREHITEIKANIERNRSAIQAQRKNYYKAHAEKAREHARQFRLRNPDHYKNWAKRYYKEHPEKLWRKQHPEEAKAMLRRARKAWLLKPENRAKIQARVRARKARTKSSLSAVAFYKLIRSKERVRCYYCKEWISGKEAHIDHVIALAKDGNHASENLCASCAKCNLKKHSSLPSEIRFLDQPLLDL